MCDYFFFFFKFQIASVIDSYAGTLNKRTDRDVFFMTCQGIVQLVQRYRNGIRGHMKSIVQELLRHYLRVELQFQQGVLAHTCLVIQYNMMSYCCKSDAQCRNSYRIISLLQDRVDTFISFIILFSCWFAVMYIHWS